MTSTIHTCCPVCHKGLRVPADWLARPVRCKFCRSPLVVRVPGTQSDLERQEPATHWLQLVAMLGGGAVLLLASSYLFVWLLFPIFPKQPTVSLPDDESDHHQLEGRPAPPAEPPWHEIIRLASRPDQFPPLPRVGQPIAGQDSRAGDVELLGPYPTLLPGPVRVEAGTSPADPQFLDGVRWKLDGAVPPRSPRTQRVFEHRHGIFPPVVLGEQLPEVLDLPDLPLSN